MEKNKYPAKRGRAALPPNMYSGAYLISNLLSCPRPHVTLHKKMEDGLRIYQYKGTIYVAAWQDKEPPEIESYRWEQVGRLRQRDIFKATRVITV